MPDVKISALPAAAALTGTEEVPIVQSSSTVKTTTQDIANLAALPYKVYVAKVSYSGSFTISIKQNTLGGTVTWSDPAITSYYKLATSALFTSGKTVVMSAITQNGGVPYFVLDSGLSGTSDIYLQFIKFDGTVSSTPFFDNLVLEIRVYP